MPSKTTTKKPNNKSSLKKRFDLTNRKVQFFVVIAIVAVLGGGYFTVRSFAATTPITYTPRQLDFTNQNCTVNKFGIDPAKNSLNTFDVACTNGFVDIKTPFAEPVITGLHRACTSVRGGGTISIELYSVLVTPGSPSTKQTHSIINDGTYRKYCSGIKDFSNRGASVKITVSSPSIVKISTLEIVPVSAAPAK